VRLAGVGSARAIRNYTSGISTPSSRTTDSNSVSTLNIPTTLLSSPRVSPTSSVANIIVPADDIDGSELPVVDNTTNATPALSARQQQQQPSSGAVPPIVPRVQSTHALRSVQTENLFMRHRHQEIVMEISELLHQELVSRTLQSGFREQLEATVNDHLGRTGQSGQSALEALANLPPTGHLRFPRAAGGDFFWEHDAASNADSDNISLVSARFTTNAGAHIGDSTIMLRQQAEITKMKTEMKKVKQTLQLVFDMQIDLQRSMKQELAAALHRDPTRAEVPAAQVQRSGPVRTGQCLICLDGKAEIVVYRCGHLCMCHKCSLTLPHHQTTVTCPVCRAPIVDLIRVYDLGNGSNTE